MKWKWVFLLLIVVLLAGGGYLAWPQIHEALFYITGEEVPLAQASGTALYLLTLLQPPLQTDDMGPIRHTGMAPFGVNTFLQNEVEFEKRERAMQLVSEAGFHWIRQEFTWEDIEIHGKGDFEDRRTEPYKSAWIKYDHIVDMAEKYDVQIMARLSNPPAWTRAQGNEIGTYAPPDNVTDYGDFVELVAWRYRNRIKVYQIWNEPNIYPEWGLNPINAAEYVALLKEAYLRIKAVDPEAIVVMGALAATIELDRERTEGVSPGGLSDALFLQQIYDAGGGAYFDVLAMQGYGLFSGPYDRRMQPRVLNFSRPRYIRDVIVRNGDSHKPIWLSEMGWNAVPLELGIPPIYGHVTPEQQGRYGALAYQRIQEEWPWLGVGFYWFLKQASDQELKNGDPQYFFRLLEPDFTPMPAYTMLQESLTQPPVMHRGFHQEDHWATTYSENWQVGQSDKATFGKVLVSQSPGATVRFTFYGTRLQLVTLPHPDGGQIQVQVNDETAKVIDLSSSRSSQVTLVGAVPKDRYDVSITVIGETPVRIDGFIVQSYPTRLLSYAGSFIMLFAAIFGVWAIRRK
ncbi:MAG: hypothetical protein AAF629_22615 [Chloroflexota bacterium]